jgi:hypothetical protein
MKLAQLFFISIIFLSSVFATDVVYATEKKVDCVVLKDENSIICKYSHKRVNKDTTVRFEWIAPNGDVSRQRDMIIPAGHGSVYDYRYIKGREIGTWIFKVVDEQEEYKTTFDIE